MSLQKLFFDRCLECKRHDIDRKTIEELRIFLKIEGLLDKYGYIFDNKGNAKNSYQGKLFQDTLNINIQIFLTFRHKDLLKIARTHHSI